MKILSVPYNDTWYVKSEFDNTRTDYNLQKQGLYNDTKSYAKKL